MPCAGAETEVAVRVAERVSGTSLASTPIEAARLNRFKPDWSLYKPTKPQFTGTRVLKQYDLAKIAQCPPSQLDDSLL